MIIDSVRILNFKSLKDCLFSFKDIDVNGIKAGVLVGLNESGKSSFLEAISLVNKGFDDVDYEECCYLDEQDDDEYLEMYITYSVKNINELRKELLKYKRFCKEIVNELIIENITNNTYIDKEGGSSSSVSFTYKDFDVSKYRFEIKESKNSLGELVEIKNLVSNIGLGKDTIYEEVSRESLESFLKPYLKGILKLKRPEIIIWKPSREYLINEVIDLRKFMMEPDNVSVPLKNIFNIYGKTTTEEIANCIENALKSHSNRDRLVDGMSDAITKYVNKTWKEHKIKIRVSIDGGMCNVMIEDTDKKYSYFNMEQRSDGFKQFFSLILSLSTLNESNVLKNKIILIDEPEVHLHPSGIQYMREEILKIARNNTVIVATHSQFMIDLECPERHFIVSKQKGVTSIKQVDDSTNFKDDSVLKSAFGLNLYKELLPSNILIVEGGGDKAFIDHCIKKCIDVKNYSVKSAGGASKVTGFASLLSGEALSAFILLDADKEGKDTKSKVLNGIKNGFTKDNVFTLKDILSSLPDNSTIEDLYPLEYVYRELTEYLDSETALDDKISLIDKLNKSQEWKKLESNKKESIKTKLSNDFINTFTSKESLLEIPRVRAFLDEFVRKTGL